MKLILPLVFAVALVPSFANARLGETPEQCDARYGVPVRTQSADEPYDTLRVYQRGGFTVIADFMDGACHGLFFSKLDGSLISRGEFEGLLSLNGQGFEWKLQPQIDIGKTWFRFDGAIARTPDGKSVLMTSKPALDKAMLAKKRREVESMAGF